MLMIQPAKEVILEYIKQEDFKYAPPRGNTISDGLVERFLVYRLP